MVKRKNNQHKNTFCHEYQNIKQGRRLDATTGIKDILVIHNNQLRICFALIPACCLLPLITHILILSYVAVSMATSSRVCATFYHLRDPPDVTIRSTSLGVDAPVVQVDERHPDGQSAVCAQHHPTEGVHSNRQLPRHRHR